MPKYCQQHDRENEVQAMEQLRARCARECPDSRWEVKQQSDLCAYDGILYRDGKAFGVVEVRGRNGDPSRYSEWHTRKAKVEKIKAAAQRMAAKCFLIVTWNGLPYVVDALKLPANLPSHISGRTDRNDPHDIEEMLLIPSNLFQRV